MEGIWGTICPMGNRDDIVSTLKEKAMGHLSSYLVSRGGRMEERCGITTIHHYSVSSFHIGGQYGGETAARMLKEEDSPVLFIHGDGIGKTLPFFPRDTYEIRDVMAVSPSLFRPYHNEEEIFFPRGRHDFLRAAVLYSRSPLYAWELETDADRRMWAKERAERLVPPLTAAAVLREGAIVACGNLSMATGDGVMLSDILVEERWRRKGIGSALSSALTRAAFDEGFSCVSLFVSGDEAKSMYGKLGYVKAGEMVRIRVPRSSSWHRV